MRGNLTPNPFPCGKGNNRGRVGALRDFETGTGFAGAKLSEILRLRALRTLRLRMTDEERTLRIRSE
jgi:hypothetical protein